MHYTIIFDNDLSSFIISATGPATVPDIVALVNEALKDGRWRSGMNVIVDYRLTELDVLKSAEAHALADFIIRFKEKIGAGHIAHVVSRTVDYGMIRMWENLIADQVPFDARVFYSLDDARKWIDDAAA
jgi:hypothetical protein